MHPDMQRRLESRLNDDEYSCDKFCVDLPYTLWNTCPLCICGLLPVAVVCFSAIFRMDYATNVTEMGAHIIDEMGLSYTVYYTAGCWPGENEGGPAISGAGGLGGTALRASPDWKGKPQCNKEHFEVAAADFEAISGSPLRKRNITRLHARRVEAVKVTPDWRYVVFVGALANDIGNVYTVDARETDAEQAVPLLQEEELDALDSQCQLHSASVLGAAGGASRRDAGRAHDGRPGNRPPSARLAGLKHLQVIIPGFAPSTGVSDSDETAVPEAPKGSSPKYRAAFAFECAEVSVETEGIAGSPGVDPLRFSKLAIIDFQLLGLNRTDNADPTRRAPYARSQLRIIDAVPVSPSGSSAFVDAAVDRFKSQSCPRFVPSKQGRELLFVAEDVNPTAGQLPSAQLPARWLALVGFPGRGRNALGSRALSDEGGNGDGPFPDDEARPRSCCRAMTAECLACSNGVTQAQFCARAGSRHIPGCEDLLLDLPDDSDRCCTGARASCLACRERRSVESFCAEPGNHGVPGCRDQDRACCQERTARCLACQEGTSVSIFCIESGKHAGVPGCEEDVAGVEDPGGGSGFVPPRDVPLEFLVLRAEATLLNLLGVGEGTLPAAPVRGCPEFVPSLFLPTESLAKKLTDRVFNTPRKQASAQLSEKRLRDTFTIISEPTSASVLGIDAQVLAVSLPEGPPTGRVSRVHVLYNVDNAPASGAAAKGGGGGARLRLGGCQPIRAAGRKGHMRLQWILETLMVSLQLHSDKSRYTAWLACLTADQKIAIVESPKREHWINMTMPYPMWTEHDQRVWCPDERQEACFEVWSNPNPNE